MKSKSIFLQLIIVFLFQNILLSQSFNIEWQQCFGGTENEAASDILIHNGYYYILGSTESNNGDIGFLHGGQDGWLIKASSTGEIIWEKTYGGTNGDHLLRILPAPENTFYLLGSSYSSDGDISNDPYPESTDYWILKVDSIGNILWDKILGGNTLDQMWTGTSTNDGGVIAFGWTGSDDGDVTIFYGFYDMWMVKLNSDGELEWDFTLGTSGLDAGQAIIQTSDEGFLVGGTSSIENGGNLSCIPHSWMGEAILVKLDEDGNIEWQQCYGGSEHDGVTALAELSDGYVFGGYVGSNDGDISGWHGENDIWMVKVDLSGNIIWQKCLGGSDNESTLNILQTIDGGYIIAGNTKSIDGDVTGNHTISEHEHDIWVVKLNGEGELIWEQCFGGVWDEQVNFGFIKKSDNNFVIAGQTDYGPSFDVACTPHGGNYDKDFWVFEIKDTLVGIHQEMSIENKLKVYPNPARDYVVFELLTAANNKKTVISNPGAGTGACVRNPPTTSQSAGKNPTVNGSHNSEGIPHSTAKGKTQGFGMTVVLFDVFGQEVTRLPVNPLSGSKPLSGFKTVWDTRDIKNGIYFYRLEIDETVFIGKIVVQK